MSDSGSVSVLTLGDFLEFLERDRSAQLVFSVGGIAIKPGYHVTELKSMSVSSIDCGRRQTAWFESVIQLLDGPAVFSGSDGSFMDVSKFEKIVSASLAAIPELRNGVLYFEYSPGNGATHKFSVGDIEFAEGKAVVTLKAVVATCKPATTWSAPVAPLEKTPSKGCCGSESLQCCTT